MYVRACRERERTSATYREQRKGRRDTEVCLRGGSAFFSRTTNVVYCLSNGPITRVSPGTVNGTGRAQCEPFFVTETWG